MPKVSSTVHIDMANTSSAFTQLKGLHRLDRDIKLDFTQLVNHVATGTDVISKYIYSETREGSYKFLDFFRHNGFSVITKELKTISLTNGETKNKANFDVEITYNITRGLYRRDFKKVFLFSGDSDFAYLVSQLKEDDIKVCIISSRSHLSKELHELADEEILLEELINRPGITFKKAS